MKTNEMSVEIDRLAVALKEIDEKHASSVYTNYWVKARDLMDRFFIMERESNG